MEPMRSRPLDDSPSWRWRGCRGQMGRSESSAPYIVPMYRHHENKYTGGNWPQKGFGESLMKKEWNYRRGDLYMADLNPYQGSEQGGVRPVLVVQNDVGNAYGPTLIVAPLTTRVGKKVHLPTHCRIQPRHGVPEVSMVLLEQLRTIDKSRVCHYLGRATQEEMEQVDRALQVSLGMGA